MQTWDDPHWVSAVQTTHAFVVVLQYGVARLPAQSASEPHCLATQVWFVHCRFTPQLAFVTQATQVWAVVSQAGRAADVQSAFDWQPVAVT